MITLGNLLSSIYPLPTGPTMSQLSVEDRTNHLKYLWGKSIKGCVFDVGRSGVKSNVELVELVIRAKTSRAQELAAH